MNTSTVGEDGMLDHEKKLVVKSEDRLKMVEATKMHVKHIHRYHMELHSLVQQMRIGNQN